MAADLTSQGMALGVDTAGGSTYVAIGDVVSFSGPGSSRTAIQVGANDSANSTNVQKAGRTTRGGWNFTVNFDPDSAPQARQAYAQMQVVSATVNTVATSYAWAITFNGGATGEDRITFDGFVSNFSIDGADDGVVAASFTVTLQTDLTFDTVPA